MFGDLILPRLRRLRAKANHIADGGDLRSRLLAVNGAAAAKLAEFGSSNSRLAKAARPAAGVGEVYRAIVQDMADGIFLLDVETGRILEANPAFQQMVGYTGRELMQLSLYDLVTHASGVEGENILKLLAAKGQELGDRKFRQKNGSLVEAEISGSLIGHDQNQVACLVARDVTRRKWAEDAVRRNEAYFRALIDNALDVIGILNVDGTVCYLSPGIERMLGFKRERLTGRNAFDMIHEDDAARTKSIFTDAIQNPNLAASAEFRLQRQDGAWVNVEATAHNMLDDPAVMGVIISMRDITERKRAEERLRESEERYRQEVENSPNPIFRVNREGIIQTWNRACETVFKYGQEVLGSDLTRFLRDGQDRQRLAGMVDQVFEKQTFTNIEISYRCQDGEVRIMASRLFPVFGKGGEVEECVFANTDITESRNARAETESRAREFEALFRNAQELATQPDLPALLNSIIEGACTLLSAPSGGIYLYDDASGCLEMTVGRGWGNIVGTRLQLGEGTAGRVAQTRQPLIVDDYRTWEYRSPQYEGLPIRAVVQVPMLWRGELVGVLTVNEVGDATRKFAEADARLLALFAAQAASAVHNAHLLDQTRARAEQLALLYDAGLALNGVLEPRAQMEFLFRVAMKTLKADRAEFFRFDPVSGELGFELGVGHSDDTAEAVRGLKVALGEERGLIGQVAEKRMPRYLPDVTADPRWVTMDPEIKSALWVPVEHEDRLLGVLAVLSIRVDAFSPQDERLLVLYGNQAAVALENARLFEETRLRADRLVLLNHVASALSQTLNLDELLEVIYREISAALQADAFYIALYDAASDEMNYRIRIDEGVRESPERRRLGPGLSAHVIRTKQPLLIRDWEDEKEHYPPVPVWGSMKMARSSVYVPLVFQGTVLGVISVQSYQPNAFGEEEERLLSTIADQAAIAVEKARLFAETEHRLQRLHALGDIDRAISSSLDLRVTLEVVLEQVTIQLHVDAADILLHNLGTETLTFASGRGFRSRALQFTELHLGEGLAGTAALERRMVHFPNLVQEADGLRRSPLLASEGFIAYFAVPLLAKGQIKGVLEIFHRAPLEPDQEWLEFAQALASQAAIAIDDAELFDGLQRSNVELRLAYDAAIEGWSRALELRDQETRGHAARVAEMALRMARGMGIRGQELAHVRHGALLHDIGKMAVPDAILFKPGPLSPEEWDIMRRHPTYAYQMLSPITYLREALEIPYCHHERWDGTGYPRGLKCEEIPLSARIFAVVDVWDALRSDRPYGSAWSEDHATQYIREQAGKQFDPAVVDEFLKINAVPK